MEATMVSPINETYNASCDPFKYKWKFSIWFTAYYTLLCFIGLTLNSFALYVLWHGRQTINSTLLYLLNLTSVDFFFCAFLPLRISYFALGSTWKLGEVMCKLTAYAFFLNTYGSINFMICISIDRFFICLFVWLYTAAVNSTVPLLSNVYVKNQFGEYCMEYSMVAMDNALALKVLILSCTSYFFPLIVMLFCYLGVGLKLWKITELGGSNNSKPARTRRKSLVIIMVVLFVFIVCFTPYHSNLIHHMAEIQAGRTSCESLENFKLQLQITMSVMNLNFVLDPFIYFSAFKNHKLFLMKLFRKKNKDLIGPGSHNSLHTKVLTGFSPKCTSP
uniref:G-protein coupled receptors family 1 profile domain-containing protein n=1 Tax=Erpetoichthys calabaricus TaxID=27687 RepID=A0A8C4SVQ5_ERPCA